MHIWWCHRPSTIAGPLPKICICRFDPFSRILWLKWVSIRNFIKIGCKTWKLHQFFRRLSCARDLSEKSKLRNSTRFSSAPTTWYFVHFTVFFFYYIIDLTYTLMIQVKTVILFHDMYQLMLLNTPGTPGGQLILSEKGKLRNSVIFHFKKKKTHLVQYF